MRGRGLVTPSYSIGFNFPLRTIDLVAQMAEKIKPFANLIPIAVTSLGEISPEKLKSLLQPNENVKANAIVNFIPFRLGAGPMGGKVQPLIDLLEEMQIPVLHPFFITKDEIQVWEESTQGLSPAEYLISIMLPELDGCIETIPIAAIQTYQSDNELGLELKKLTLIEERANKLVSRLKGWINLQEKPNKDKKVAIICYNYPPGETNLFGAAYLDTFESVPNILSLLKREGYGVDELTADQLMNTFTQGKLVNSGKWSGDTVSEEFIRYDAANYNEKMKTISWSAEVDEQWGPSPGTIMTEGNSFLIPGVVLENTFIGLQPSRGVHEDIDKAYHDKSLYPHHQYIAYYQWLKEEFKADVIIHVGTHGTLEFLKGKEVAMSGDCLPDYLLADIPHLYIYYSGNPSEAMTAKRRSHAVLVSYQSTPFVQSDLYGELSHLETLIDEHAQAENSDPKRCQQILEDIFSKAKELNFNFDDLEHIEQEIYRMKRSLIPKGLHTFNEGYSAVDASHYMKFVLRYDRGEVKSLLRVLAENKGLDYDDILDNNKKKLQATLDTEASDLVDFYLEHQHLPENYFVTSEIEDDCKMTLAFAFKAYQDSMNTMEGEGLLNGLSGKYLPVRLAGDMVKYPEVFPTGYNLYQFDPRQVPTKSAVECGAKIAEHTLYQYKKDHNDLPRSIGVILWGLETSRTQGETVGHILHYLGVRVVKGMFMPQFEIIPLEQLKRPRVDVIINISGFFRDMFPNLMEELHLLFKRISELEEPDEMNFLKANSKKIYSQLLEEGYSEEDAADLSVARIFGPVEGEYATKVTTIVETKNWETEQQLGDAYSDGMQHVYSANFRGQPMKELLNKHLSVVDVVSQIRSNHELEVTDLDHYYEFFGGLAKSVEMSQGKKAEIYISDTTGERVETESVEHSINRGVRTRMLNPKWIDGMLEHKYHGVQHIHERFANVLGLSATTNKVENWVFSDLHSTYIADEELKERLKENNRWAYLDIVETLMECNQRGYWDATDEELQQLKQTYLELEGSIEDKVEEKV